MEIIPPEKPDEHILVEPIPIFQLPYDLVPNPLFVLFETPVFEPIPKEYAKTITDKSLKRVINDDDWADSRLYR